MIHVHFRPQVGGEHAGTIPSGGPGRWVLVAAYLPLLAWGPLLGTLTVAYQRRRSPYARTRPAEIAAISPR